MNKNHCRILLVSAVICLAPLSVYALGAGLSAAISKRTDIDGFRNLISRTHVMEQLAGGPYTVFAPIDSAFKWMTPDSYPCFYSTQCEGEQENMLRNHIFEGNVILQDAARGAGGIYAINKHRAVIAEPTNGEYYINGHKVLSRTQTDSGTLYVIDGVIASPQEMAEFRQLKIPVVVETKTQKITVETKTPDPDSKSVTTTTTTTTVKNPQ